jgi:hypothetical protein
VLLAIPAVAFADIVTNNADATVDATVESRTRAAGASTTVGYQILNENTRDGDTPALSGDPGGVERLPSGHGGAAAREECA